MADENTPTEPGFDPQAYDRGSPSAAPPRQAPPPQAASGQPYGYAGWTGGRIAAVVAGSVLVLVSLVLLGLGGAATWLETNRSNGYVDAGSGNLTTPGYALASGRVDLGNGAWRLVGTLRVRAIALAPDRAVFIGIATADRVDAYLAGVHHSRVDNVFTLGSDQTVTHNGGAPAKPPAAARIWNAETSGPGTQTLVWPSKGGQWTVVIMNAGASPGVAVHADLGATLPPLPWAALGLVAGGVLLLAGSLALIVVPIRRAAGRV